MAEVTVKSKISSAMHELKSIKPTTEAEECLLEVAKQAIKALRALRRGNLEKTMAIIPIMAQTADKAGMAVIEVSIGQDFGPYTQPPAILSSN
jgi:hypothetical protein